MSVNLRRAFVMTSRLVSSRAAAATLSRPSFTFRQPILTRPSALCSINLANSFASQAEVKKQIDQMVKSKPVVLFIKGTADQPRCGFSKAVVDIMNLHGVKFETHNVLEDESLRSGIKEYSNWPTIPQIFFKGEFIGGCDILLEMHRSGELVDELKKIGIKSKLEDEQAEPEKKK